MQPDSPLISIIIPSYNRAELIAETLDSVSQQTYKNWECIIVDDGSRDNSQQLFQTYLINDHRFRLINRNREPKGAPVCRNIGIGNALGNYIIFLDSDDLLSENCLENRVKHLQLNPGFDFWVFKTAVFKFKPGDTAFFWNVLNKDIVDMQRFIMGDLPWHTSGPIWTKQAIQRIKGFDETAICWQDWEFHIRALLTGLQYYKSDDTYHDSFYRKDPENKANSISKSHMDLTQMMFRIELFNKMFDTTIAGNKDVNVINAYAVLFSRLIYELFEGSHYSHIKTLIKLLKGKHIFTPVEILVLQFLCFNIRNTILNKIKTKVAFKTLKFLNKNRFYNTLNSTFQH